MMSLTIACGPTPQELLIISIFIIFIPTIIIEAILLKNILKRKWGESFGFCTIANMTSTIAGIIFATSVLYIANSLDSINNTVEIICCILTLAIIILIKYAIYQVPWKDIPKKKLIYAIIRINIITLGIFPIVLAFMPPLHSTREKARRISCNSNLKGIGLSLKQYATDYNNFFPNEGLEQLRSNDYLTDYGIYQCPSTNTRKGEDNEKLTDEIVDYVYRKGLKDSDDSKTPLAWDKPENHEDYGNVLFVDGHVKGFIGANWMEQAGIKKAEK